MVTRADLPGESHSYFVVQSGVQSCRRLQCCSAAVTLLQTLTGTAGSVTSHHVTGLPGLPGCLHLVIRNTNYQPIVELTTNQILNFQYLGPEVYSVSEVCSGPIPCLLKQLENDVMQSFRRRPSSSKWLDLLHSGEMYLLTYLLQFQD